MFKDVNWKEKLSDWWNFAKNIFTTALSIVVVIVLCLLLLLLLITPTSDTGTVKYTDVDAVKLQHPMSLKGCVQITSNGTIDTAVLKESKYQELTVKHTVKFVCKPAFNWKEERAKILTELSPTGE